MATIRDNDRYDDDTWEYLRDHILQVAETLEPRRVHYYKGQAKLVVKHFCKPLEDFDTSAVERIGRKIVARRAMTYFNEVDGDIIDLLLVDDQGDCYDVEEARSPDIVLSPEEIRVRAKEARNLEYLKQGDER